MRAQQLRDVAERRSTVSLVLERGGQTQRLKQVFLVQARESAFGASRAVVALDAQERHAVVRAGAEKLGTDDRQAYAPGDVVGDALGDAYPSYGLELQEVARWIRAVRQRIRLAIEDDRLLFLCAGQGEPLPVTDQGGSLFADGADQPVDLCLRQRFRRRRPDVRLDISGHHTEGAGAILPDGEEESRVVLERDASLPADTLACPTFRQQTGDEGVGIHLFVTNGQG